MSTLRVQRIEARAFKAFKHLDFRLDGRHLLAYGGNGAGKSSLYWTLYTFLQSAAKTTPDLAKYFEIDGKQNLLNVHATAQEKVDATVVVTLKDANRSYPSVYSLTHDLHDTQGNSEVLKANMASDFITYRVLSSFYQFRNSQAIDLWPVFEQEILPFAQGTTTKDIAALWITLNTDPFQISRARSESTWFRKRRYERFDRDVASFNQALNEALSNISTQAQLFYDANFAEPGQTVRLRVGMTAPASNYDRKAHRFTVPSIGFEIELNGDPLRKPQSFLNEAKLTQLALSVRFGSTLAHLHDSPMKLLVLDDLLISLDMNNRMKVVNIILNETFAEHQKIILTHDLGFFNEFRRRSGASHTDWSFQHFKTTPQNGVGMQVVKDEIQKAEDYLHGQNLDEAATQLRKSADNAAKRWREWLTGTKLPPGKFFSLTENLNAAKNKLLQSLPLQLHSKILLGTPLEILEKLVPQGIEDLAGFAEMTPEIREKITSKRKDLHNLLTTTQWSAIENIRLIDDLLATTQRVLNPSAHGNEVPLYEAEVQNALDLIKQLKQLSESDADL